MAQALAVSDLHQITGEIKALKNQTAQNIIEIGKRLKTVRDSLEHGQFVAWLQREVEFSSRTAQRFIQASDQFGNATTSSGLSTGKLFELIALPESVNRQEFVEQPHTVPSTGESKTVDEMTVRELREVKAALTKTQRERDEAIEQALSLQERDRQLQTENERLKWEKNPEPVVKVERVEVLPDDYGTLRETVKRQDARIAALTREELDRNTRFQVERIVRELDLSVASSLTEIRHKVADGDGEWISDTNVSSSIRLLVQHMSEASKELQNLLGYATKHGQEVVIDGVTVIA